MGLQGFGITHPGQTWYGGDPLTWQHGDPGALGGLGNPISTQQAEGITGNVQQSAWATSAENQMKAGNWKAAFQQDYNNAQWELNNTIFNPSTANLTTDTVPQAQTVLADATGFVTSARAADLVGIATGAAAVSAGGPVGYVIGSAGAGIALTQAINDCQQYLPNIPTSPDPNYYPQASALGEQFAFAASDAVAGSAEMGATNVDGAAPAKPLGSAAASMTMTPGFTPSAAILAASKPFMTSHALATYFPHG